MTKNNKKTIKSRKNKKTYLLIRNIIILIIALIGGYFAYEEIGNSGDLSNYKPLPIEEYYEGAEGLYKDELKTFLHNLLNKNFNSLKYSEAKVALAEADASLTDKTKVLTIYSRDLVQAEWISGNDGWTREHVWPNSRLGVERVEESDKNIATDLHNLRAIVQIVNSSRSNKYYDTKSTSESYYPGDEDKGDVARILFYMVVMYPHLTLRDIELEDNPETNYLPEGAVMGKLSLLLQWHKEDPVDQFEKQRNEVIYKWQYNRNPFIDHPEFVHYIFEDVIPEEKEELSNKIYYYFEQRKEIYFYA